jgi:hypothetical protein
MKGSGIKFRYSLCYCRVGIAHQKRSAIVNEMVGNAHPTITSKKVAEGLIY